MAIKRIKIASVFVNEEKEIKSKKDGKVYKLCEVGVKVADDCADYTGRWIKTTIFEYIDKKDPKKNSTATSKAEYFKSQNEGKDLLMDITEESYVDKEGENKIALKFKLLTKAQKEVAEQFIK